MSRESAIQIPLLLLPAGILTPPLEGELPLHKAVPSLLMAPVCSVCGVEHAKGHSKRTLLAKTVILVHMGPWRHAPPLTQGLGLGKAGILVHTGPWRCPTSWLTGQGLGLEEAREQWQRGAYC